LSEQTALAGSILSVDAAIAYNYREWSPSPSTVTQLYRDTSGGARVVASVELPEIGDWSDEQRSMMCLPCAVITEGSNKITEMGMNLQYTGDTYNIPLGVVFHWILVCLV
jgi:hypothetical protein